MPSPSPIVVVAGHACLDIIPTLPEPPDLKPNTLTRIGPAAISGGGAVPNVGLALHRIGLKPRLVASVGDDELGKMLTSLLARFDLSYGRTLVVQSGGTTSYSIVIAPPGIDRAFWHCPGTNDVIRPQEIPVTALQGAHWLHVGYPPIMLAFARDPQGTAALFAKAKEVGAALRTSLDFCSIPKGSSIDWREWLSIVLPRVDFFVPSFDEMADVLGLDPVISPGAVRAVVSQLRNLGASGIALKLGEFGLFFSDGNRERYVPCLEVAAATTTGAGDCTIAGLIAGLARGDSLEVSLCIAVAAGAASCEAADATSGVPSLDELIARVRSGWRRSDRLLFPNPLEMCL